MAEPKQKPAQQFAAKSSWKGTITFGLVSVPVKVYGATDSRDVSFNQISKVDGSRIRYKKVRESDGKEIENDEVGKGYQYEEGKYVTITDEEIKGFQAAMKGLKSLDIVEFVPEDAVDPVMHDKAYYVGPEHEAGGKAYALLREAMRSEKVVGIAKLIVSNKEHMALVRVSGEMLVLQTMFWPDEVKTPAFDLPDATVTREELKMARTLVGALKTDELDTSKYTDEYRETLLGFIASKASGEVQAIPAQVQAKKAAVDVMEQLRQSVEAMKEAV